MKHMSNTLQTNNLHQFLITRDGSIDWEAHEALERQERSELLHSASRELIQATAATAIATARSIGHGIVTWYQSI